MEDKKEEAQESGHFFSVNSIYEIHFLIFKGKKRKIGGGILKTSMKKDKVESNHFILISIISRK